MVSAQIRYWGAGQRETMANCHFQHGNAIGFETAQRFVWEIARFISEVQGFEIAAEMCFKAGDAILAGRREPCESVLAGLLKIEGGNIEIAATPAPSEAAASLAPAEVRTWLRERINETFEWLQTKAPHMAGTTVTMTPSENNGWHLGYLSAVRDFAEKLREKQTA